MNRITIYTLLIFISQYSFIQCNSSKKSLESSSYPNPYFPLKNNANWKYINEPPREESIIIDVKCTASGERTYELNKFPFFGNYDAKNIIDVNNEGDINLKNAGGESLFLAREKNLREGYVWTCDGFAAYVTTKTQEINTEAGSFDCIYIMFTDGFTFSYEMWLAKNVGVVKWGANRTNPPTLKPVYYVLKEYSIP